MFKDSAVIVRHKSNRSFCPECLDIVESNIIDKNGKIYLDICCPKHGKSENLHKWEDQKYYEAMNNPETEDIRRYPTGLLIDTNFDCNQDCNFCYAQANERKEEPPSVSEILSKADAFRGIHVMLAGVNQPCGKTCLRLSWN